MRNATIMSEKVRNILRPTGRVLGNLQIRLVGHFVWSGLCQRRVWIGIGIRIGARVCLRCVCFFSNAICFFFCLDCFPSEWYNLKLPHRPGALLISVLSPKKSRRRSNGFVLFALWFSFPRSLAEKMWEKWERNWVCWTDFFFFGGVVRELSEWSVRECCRIWTNGNDYTSASNFVLILSFLGNQKLVDYEVPCFEWISLGSIWTVRD